MKISLFLSGFADSLCSETHNGDPVILKDTGTCDPSGNPLHGSLVMTLLCFAYGRISVYSVNTHFYLWDQHFLTWMKLNRIILPWTGPFHYILWDGKGAKV